MAWKNYWRTEQLLNDSINDVTCAAPSVSYLTLHRSFTELGCGSIGHTFTTLIRLLHKHLLCLRNNLASLLIMLSCLYSLRSFKSSFGNLIFKLSSTNFVKNAYNCIIKQITSWNRWLLDSLGSGVYQKNYLSICVPSEWVLIILTMLIVCLTLTSD